MHYNGRERKGAPIMPFGYRRRDESEWGPASNAYEDPDWLHAANDYGAAARDSWAQGEPPPQPFAVDDWRTAEDASPTTPEWARDEPEPERWEPGPGRRSGWFRGGWG